MDYCMQCKGLWFDSGEIELLAEKLALQAPLLGGPFVESAERQRRCPRCDLRMKHVMIAELSEVTTEGCPANHGIWLDRGELGKLLSARRDDSTNAGSAVVSFLGEVLAER